MRSALRYTAAEDYNMAAQRRVRKSCDKHEYFKLDSFCRPVEFYLWKNAGTEQALRFDIFAVVCDFFVSNIIALLYFFFALQTLVGDRKVQCPSSNAAGRWNSQPTPASQWLLKRDTHNLPATPHEEGIGHGRQCTTVISLRTEDKKCIKRPSCESWDWPWLKSWSMWNSMISTPYFCFLIDRNNVPVRTRLCSCQDVSSGPLSLQHPAETRYLLIEEL